MLMKKNVRIIISIIAILLLSACISNSSETPPAIEQKVTDHPEADPVQVVSNTYSLLQDKIGLKIDKIIYSKENGICVISLVSSDFSPLSSNEDNYYKDCCTIAKELFVMKEIDVVILPYLNVSKTGEVEIEASYGIKKDSPIQNYWDEIFRVKDYKKTVEFFFTDMKTYVTENYNITNRAV